MLTKAFNNEVIWKTKAFNFVDIDLVILWWELMVLV